MKFFIAIFFVTFTAISISSCSKNDYFYNPSGLSNADFNGTIVDYIDSRKDYFDTLSQVIRLSGLQDVLNSEDITFFAPPDSTIARSLEALNNRLFLLGRPKITSLAQISQSSWNRMLSRYIFKGQRRMKDFVQIDIANMLAFPGGYFQTVDSTLMNIGVVFTDLVQGRNTLQYQGYRYLMIAYIPSDAAPTIDRRYAEVATSDIKPTNGVVHVLRINQAFGSAENHAFGFDATDFVNTVFRDGIDYSK